MHQLLVDLLRSPQPKLLDVVPPELFDQRRIYFGGFCRCEYAGKENIRTGNRYLCRYPAVAGVVVGVRKSPL